MLKRAKTLTLGATALGLALGGGADPAAAQLTFSGSAAGGIGGFITDTGPMMKNTALESGKKWYVESIFTVGESVGDYLPPGILDGMGAFALDSKTVRVLVNHELTGTAGYVYELANGTQLRGARVSYFDIDRNSRRIVGSGMAYDKVVDRNGRTVTRGTQVSEGADDALEGFQRFCSSAYFGAGEYGLVDGIYFTGEETGEGQAVALDAANGVLYVVPWMGRAAWENVTLLDSGDDATVAILVGDDRQGAPLTLYIGEKNAVGDGSFLDRNGLAQGTLHVWVSDSGDVDPEDFNGTGANRSGRFVAIEHFQPENAGTDGFDADGFATMSKQDELAEEAGAFQLSRPEDLSTNPTDGTQVVLASTGRGQAFNGADDLGTTYIINVDFSDLSADLNIVYDGDDAGNGQFFGPDFGMRSPDNLDWADDGKIYLQEDRSTRLNPFGGESFMEASIWEMDPETGDLTRILVMDRSVLPAGQSDGDPGDLGDWESSGVLDVTSLFKTRPGETLLIGNVQAHSVRDGIIADAELVQGGQLILMSSREIPRTEVLTRTESMIKGREDWNIWSIFTVGEDVGGYLPPGILDGIGAYALDERTVRVLVNHELTGGAGYVHELANGTELTGARVSYFDIDRESRRIVASGMAYDTVIDRNGEVVTSGTQISEGADDALEGFQRFCSSGYFGAGEYGLVDGIYFTGEETGNGQAVALDVKRGVLHVVPWMGRAAWENVTLLDSGDDGTVAILIGDDRQGAPLGLYIGEKDAVGDDSFLDRNGLAQGTLHVWVSDSGDVDPEDFNGTGQRRSGRFVAIEHFQPENAGTDGFDELGFASLGKQDELAEEAGAFQLSRPEDLATNPTNGTQVVLASTGRGQAFNGADDMGTTYIIDVNFSNLSATLDIIYDGDDAGNGQFPGVDFGMRSPDNLDWADDGMVYLQEDRSTRLNRFGGESGIEASMWKLDPNSGALTRIGVVDRSVLPAGQTDGDPDDLGDWETSGVLDVTNLFKTRSGERLLIGNVQAHSVRDGVIADEGLVQGGQLILMSKQDGPSAKLASLAEEDAGLSNLPNPFNPTTSIRFSLREAGPVSLTVFNTQGQTVAKLLDNTPYSAGRHAVEFDGAKLASGMYFYRLEAGSAQEVRKMTLMK